MKDIDFAAPKSLAEAVGLLHERGDRARLLAGGTDIIVQLREYRREADVLIDVKHIPELSELRWQPERGLTIGAAVPCYRIYEHREISAAFPGLIDAVALIGGIQIQSRASVGGNLCNSSPAADTVPALIAHQAVCTIAGPKGLREVPVDKFCTGPGAMCSHAVNCSSACRYQRHRVISGPRICASFRATKWTSPWSAPVSPSHWTKPASAVCRLALHLAPWRLRRCWWMMPAPLSWTAS